MRPFSFALTQLSASAAAATVAGVLVATLATGKFRKRGRAKFVDREGHLTEKATGIVLFVAGAILIRHAVILGIDQILRRALDANDRENTDRDNKTIAVIAIHKRAGDGARYRLGDVRAAAHAAAAGRARLDHACREQDGVYDLYNTDRQIGRMIFGITDITGADGRITAVNVDVPYTAVKDDLFLNDGNAGEFLIAADTDAGLELHLDIKTDGDLIKSAIEANRIHTDKGPKDPCAFGADRGGVINDLLTELREIDADVLIAIPVAAGVKHTESIDTDGFPFALPAAGARGASIIRHVVNPPIMQNIKIHGYLDIRVCVRGGS